MQHKWTITILFAALIALLIPISVFATSASGIVNSATFYCDAVIVNYEIYPASPTSLEVINASNTVLGSQFHGTASGTFTTTLYLYAAVAEGTQLTLRMKEFATPISFSGSATGNCSGLLMASDDEAPPPPPPAYQLFGGQNARTSILLVDEDNDSSTTLLAFYDINEESEGSLLFYFNSNDPVHTNTTGETVLIYENAEEFIAFYRLASGEYQVNLGPDFEAKMHVLRFQWDGGEPYDVTYDTYFVVEYSFFQWVRLNPASTSLLSIGR